MQVLQGVIRFNGSLAMEFLPLSQSCFVVTAR